MPARFNVTGIKESGLIAPCVPRSCTLSRKEFEIRAGRQHGDPLTRLVGLAGMLAQRRDNQLRDVVAQDAGLAPDG